MSVPTSMFQVGIVPTNYSTNDISSTNQYNYRNLIDVYPVYQLYQDQYDNTRQINPISLATLSPTTLDPSNLPCDVRPMIYEQGDADNREKLNLHRTPLNNPNLWQSHLPAKSGYYNNNEHNANNNIRPISAINVGQSTSAQDIRGFYV